MTPTRRDRVLAGALVLAALLLGVLAALRDPLPLPVLARFGRFLVPVAAVQGTAAVVVPVALVALLAAARATGRLRRGAVLWAHGAAAPIVVFLVARLNGVEDAAALVLVYAAAGGGVLLRALGARTGDPVPQRLEAVLGIVPWGVVAFTQVGGLIAGTPPSVPIRLLTVVVLAATVAEWIAAYRRRTGLGLVALPGALLAVLVLVLVAVR